jgi:phospholipase D1/2
MPSPVAGGSGKPQVGLVIVVIGATATILVGLSLFARLVDTHAVASQVRDVVGPGAPGAAAVFGIGVLASCACFSMSVLAVFNALVLGTPVGLAVTVGAAATSAVVQQRVGRAILNRKRRARLDAVVERVRPLVSDHGLITVMAVRLAPLSPFAPSNYALGAFELRKRVLLLGTAIAVLPRSWLIIGVTNDVFDSSSPLSLPGLIYGLAPSVAGIWILGRLAQAMRRSRAPRPAPAAGRD